MLNTCTSQDKRYVAQHHTHALVSLNTKLKLDHLLKITYHTYINHVFTGDGLLCARPTCKNGLADPCKHLHLWSRLKVGNLQRLADQISEHVPPASRATRITHSAGSIFPPRKCIQMRMLLVYNTIGVVTGHREKHDFVSFESKSKLDCGIFCVVQSRFCLV